MERTGLRRLCAALLLLFLALSILQPAKLWGALADQITTPTDLNTPAPTAEATEPPRTGKRSGYAVIRSGAKVWTSRKRTSSVGTVTANSYVWIPNTSVASLTYKVRFDTDLSTALDDCHTYYVLSEDVRWLNDAECAALEKQLEKQDVRETGGTLIPVVSFNYRKPPATPKATATPKVTPAPTVTPAPEMPTPEAEEPTSRPTRKPTATPAPTAAPDIATDTDISMPTPTPLPDFATDTDISVPTPTPLPDFATDTDLSVPAPTPLPDFATDTDLSVPTPTPVPDFATDTDLSVPTPAPGIATDTDLSVPAPGFATDTDLLPPAAELLTTAEMRSALDQTHPDRQVTIWSTCTDPYFSNGSRMTLWANVSGYEGLTYTIIWEVDRGDGLGYVNANADGLLSLSFIINDETAHWRWRAGVSIPYMEKE